MIQNQSIDLKKKLKKIKKNTFSKTCVGEFDLKVSKRKNYERIKH